MRPANCSSQSFEWSAVSMETKTVRPSPSFTGSSTATRRSITPSASRRWIRFQQGVCDSPTCSPMAAMESVASFCRSARIFRSIESKGGLSEVGGEEGLSKAAPACGATGPLTGCVEKNLF